MSMNDTFDFWKTVDKPKWMKEVSYVTTMGSRAYGCSTKDSDWDFYAFCLSPLEVLFPYLSGDVPGFGKQKQNFDQLQLQGVMSEAFGEVDMYVYSLPRYFQLCMDNNPNMLDSLMTKDESVLVLDNVGKMVRDNRKLFLSQNVYHRFRGMAFSHIKRIKNRDRVGHRKNLVDKYGYDVKDASHVVRLLLELYELMTTGDVDLMANGKTVLNVKMGEWSFSDFNDFFEIKMGEVEDVYNSGESVLPKYPDEKRIKALLVDCLEEKYGSLSRYSWNLLG